MESLLRILWVGFPLVFFSLKCIAQPFQVKWTMDYTQAGVSSDANFTPAKAVLAGGANDFTLPTVYSAGGSIVAGYIIRPWPLVSSKSRYMEFTFTANSFKYNISSISFRLRRSPSGPNKVQLRSSLDGFASDLTAITITNSDVFNSFSVPVHISNLSDNTFSIRIYAHNATKIQGVLWFDEIVINGLVLPIVLPLELTQFKAESAEKAITLFWETAWEKSTDEFLIERSSDLVNFERIGSVAAAGETSARKNYHFTDNLPISGASYYRLRLVDQDGSFSFSKTIDVHTSKTGDDLVVQPNPASPEKIIISGKDISPDDLCLTSAAGLQISFKCVKNGPNSVILLPVRLLSPGLYVLTYPKNIGKEHVKILVP
ncbi:hypothetical protein [Dyadobacter aurulentus]|uniref:hypothetical protein n=1 Tax=Dyadobacter sp. UC 10 TaxID=2605428 RepID=UPI0011F3034C|nr:hypothetical protein [Dyadobacter sp. UC 10]KAA0990932.1 hypothetical protein FXO21_12590 [Dyadobacter sp. UC 10]